MVKWCFSFVWWFYLRATRDDEEKRRPVGNYCYEERMPVQCTEDDNDDDLMLV